MDITDEMGCLRLPEDTHSMNPLGSGGPVMVYDEAAGRWRLAGVLTLHVTDGLNTHINILTRVSPYDNWIGVWTESFPLATYAVHLPAVISESLGNAIVNGDFEAGPVGWNPNHYISRDDEFPFNDEQWWAQLTPHGGRWAAAASFTELHFDTLSQELWVPADRPFLNYYYWVSSNDGCDRSGTVRVLIDGAAITEYVLCEETDTGGWLAHSIDLSASRNRPVMLVFAGLTYNVCGGTSLLLIDDVSFTSARIAEAPLPGRRATAAPSVPADRIICAD
jgi:hypothetical protein